MVSCCHRGNLASQNLIWAVYSDPYTHPKHPSSRSVQMSLNLSVLNDTGTGKLQTTAELLLGQVLKGEGHYSAYCPLLPILYCFSRRILSMKTVRIPNWNSFQKRLTFSMAQQFSLLRKAILFQSREGVYYFRI